MSCESTSTHRLSSHARSDKTRSRVVAPTVRNQAHSAGAPGSDSHSRRSQGQSLHNQATSRSLQQTDRRAPYPQIEGYTIVRLVGRGGMGTVYEAVQTNLNRRVALKILNAPAGSDGFDAIARFRREATSAGKLHHTNIISVHDYGRSGRYHFFAMDLVDGWPLTRVINNMAASAPAAALPAQAEVLACSDTTFEAHETASPGWRESTDVALSTGRGRGAAGTSLCVDFPRGREYFRQVARWVLAVANGLDFAHKKGVIHRDIKPSNLILSRDGRVMIADFGLALAPDEHAITITGAIVGTLNYMSPEQAMAKRVQVDHRTDIYSLGVTMYELLTLEMAYQGIDEKDILSKIITRDPTPPRRLDPSVPRELETICLKCMEKSYTDRFESAQELADELQRFLDDIPILVRPPGMLVRGVKLIRRNRTYAVAGLALFMILIISSTAMSYRNKQRIERSGKLLEAAVRETYDGRFRQAKAMLTDARTLAPKNPKLCYSLAWVMQREADSVAAVDSGTLLESADELCWKARYMDPPDHWGLNTHAVVLKKLGRNRDAIGAAQASLRIRPDYFPALVNLGINYALIREFDDAEAALRRATQAAATTDAKEAVDAWNNLASLLHYVNAPDALATIQRANALGTPNLGTCMVSARIHLDLGTAGGVEAALSNALTAYEITKARPDPRVIRLCAMAHLRDGQLDRAVRYCKEALELNDDAAVTYLILANAELRLGNQAVADRYLERVIRDRVHANGQGGDLVSAARGILWFETAEERNRLIVELQALRRQDE